MDSQTERHFATLPEEILCATRDSFTTEYKMLLRSSRKLFVRREKSFIKTIARHDKSVKVLAYNYVVDNLEFLTFGFLKLPKSKQEYKS